MIERPPLYVLLGGKSRRFGADKGSTLINQEPWAVHVARQLGYDPQACTQVAQASSQEDSGQRLLGKQINDHPATSGPLAGLLAALTHCQSEWLIMASCDLVHPKAEWLGELAVAAEAKPHVDVVAFQDQKRWQPFPSLWHSTCYEKLRQLCTAGTSSLQQALDQLDTVAVPWHGPEGGPPQANTPEELDRLLTGN